VTLTKDERGHLRVPVTGLVTEVNSGFQHFSHQGHLNLQGLGLIPGASDPSGLTRTSKSLKGTPAHSPAALATQRHHIQQRIGQHGTIMMTPMMVAFPPWVAHIGSSPTGPPSFAA